MGRGDTAGAYNHSESAVFLISSEGTQSVSPRGQRSREGREEGRVEDASGVWGSRRAALERPGVDGVPIVPLGLQAAQPGRAWTCGAEECESATAPCVMCNVPISSGEQGATCTERGQRAMPATVVYGQCAVCR